MFFIFSGRYLNNFFNGLYIMQLIIFLIKRNILDTACPNICLLYTSFGIIISKKIQENEVFDGLCMFLASLIFLFGITGIHVFYLKIKDRKNIKNKRSFKMLPKKKKY